MQFLTLCQDRGSLVLRNLLFGDPIAQPRMETTTGGAKSPASVYGGWTNPTRSEHQEGSSDKPNWKTKDNSSRRPLFRDRRSPRWFRTRTFEPNQHLNTRAID